MSKKPKQINFIVDCVVYPFDVMISINQTDEQLIDSLKKVNVSVSFTPEERGIKYKSEQSPATAMMFSSGKSILRMRRLPENCRDYGILAHEIFHVTTFILNEVGIPYMHMQTDEAYAYLLGYLTEKIYKGINKYY